MRRGRGLVGKNALLGGFGVRYKKKGQFFIMAAVILSVLLFSLVFTVNEVVANEEDLGFHDYALGVEREVNNVLDYQVYSGISFSNLTDFISRLEADFRDRGEKGNFVFIYGNSTNMTVKNVGANGIEIDAVNKFVLKGADDSEESKIRIGGIGIVVDHVNTEDTKVVFGNLIKGENIDIYFNEQVYKFPVSDVNQVIFIIQKDVRDETYVEVR